MFSENLQANVIDRLVPLEQLISQTSSWLSLREEVLVPNLQNSPDDPDCSNIHEVLKDMLEAERKYIALLLVLLFIAALALVCMCCFYAGSWVKPRPPKYWDRSSKAYIMWPFDDNFYQEIDVTESLLEPVQRLFDLTTEADKMGRGRDGAWSTHRRFNVLKVTRIENGKKWTAYTSNRHRMHPVHRSLRELSPEWSTWTSEALKLVNGAFASWEEDKAVARFLKSLALDSGRNERLMFHGSPTKGARDSAGVLLFDREDQAPCHAIKCGGFEPRLGSVRGMYGSGSYFADKVSKADQYAGRYNMPGEGSIGEVATIFLARVSLGTPYLTDQSLEQLRRPPCFAGHFDLHLFFNQDQVLGRPWRQKGLPFLICDHYRFDSVVGDLWIEGQQKLFREYVVYEGQQAYPEFCVSYERVAS